jgi:ABC-type branched-subunit amino acid transport system ATPase component
MEHSSTAVIRVEHLVKRYGELAAVDDISFTVNAGEIVGSLAS